MTNPVIRFFTVCRLFLFFLTLNSILFSHDPPHRSSPSFPSTKFQNLPYIFLMFIPKCLNFSAARISALLLSFYHFLRAHNFAHRLYPLLQPKLFKISVPKAGDCVELIPLYSVSKVRISFTGVRNVYVVSSLDCYLHPYNRHSEINMYDRIRCVYGRSLGNFLEF